VREYGLILSRFWLNRDLKVANERTPRTRELAAYLVSSPHCNGIGCYPLPMGYILSDLGYGSGTVTEGLGELFRNGFSAYCETTEHIFIRRFLRWNPLANPNSAKARQAEFERLPKEFTHVTELATDLLAFGKHWNEEFKVTLERLANGSRTVTEPLPQPFANQDPDPDPLQDPDPKPALPAFGSSNSPARTRAREDNGAEDHDELAAKLQAELEQRRAALGVDAGAGPEPVASILARTKAESGKRR